jgi:hypothetical protein
MKIQNENNHVDIVTIAESPKDGFVQIDIGEGTSSRHAHLRLREARAVGYALLSFAEQVAGLGPDANTTD